jgi:hypothetical protein
MIQYGGIDISKRRKMKREEEGEFTPLRSLRHQPTSTSFPEVLFSRTRTITRDSLRFCLILGNYTEQYIYTSLFILTAVLLSVLLYLGSERSTCLPLTISDSFQNVQHVLSSSS